MLTATTVDSLIDHLPERIDALICCASFEKRSAIVPNLLAERAPAQVLCFRVEEFAQRSAQTWKSLKFARTSKIENINVPYFDQLEAGRVFIAKLRKLEELPEASIVVDITTFTHEHLLIALKLLIQFAKQESKLHFVYVGAGEYSVGESTANKWLSRGVLGVRSVLGYAGYFNPSKRLRFVGLSGFETARMLALVEKYQPHRILLGRSSASGAIDRVHYPVNVHCHDLLRQTLRGVEEFEFDAKDSMRMVRRLRSLLGDDETWNTVLAPLSTKLSTLGAGIYSIRNPGIRICYAPVLEYNFSSYATVGEKAYVFSITPHGLRGSLRRPAGEIAR